MRSAAVFFALAAAFASAADDKKSSPLEEFNIVAGNVELRDRGKPRLLFLYWPLPPFALGFLRFGGTCAVSELRANSCDRRVVHWRAEHL